MINKEMKAAGRLASVTGGGWKRPTLIAIEGYLPSFRTNGTMVIPLEPTNGYVWTLHDKRKDI